MHKLSNRIYTLFIYRFYTPSYYIYDSKKSNYKMIVEGTNGLSIDGREKGIRNLMATNLLKRLESSVNSFRLTLERIEVRIKETIEKIDDFEEKSLNHISMAAEERRSTAIPVAEDRKDNISIADFTEDFGGNEENDLGSFIGKNNSICLSDMDFKSWRRAMKEAKTRLSNSSTTGPTWSLINTSN